jgi:hypothetical protein
LGSPDHLTLPPALHAIGVASAMLVSVRLLLRAVSRRRAMAAGLRPARKPAAVLRPRRQKPAVPIRQAKPRSHFGRRGVPQ